ncbi:hypothetical protein PVK06_014038 [Gossypium arboreum]|uniref:Uncharacterized protein n=1 Tax=Gossypium arboreum TaxID=29729 RepID=A0ABR0PTF6_GOSAR|nr:hypothetical protein PVK06_014038 [Gossypium arboreum]
MGIDAVISKQSKMTPLLFSTRDFSVVGPSSRSKEEENQNDGTEMNSRRTRHS